MLAYVFWHRPRKGVDTEAYEQAQRAFHAALQVSSACFRLDQLPFVSEAGYEDWYLVEDWQGLGALNTRAIDRARRASHDHAAGLSANGWGGVYSLVKGPAAIPEGVEWRDKRPGEPSDEFLASLPNGSVWRRQLVLGPAPEFCGAIPAQAGRERIWPES